MLAKQLKTETKEQKGGFFRNVISPLLAILLPNLLTGKGAFRAGEDTLRAGQHF